jgi:hypothetical protein
MKTAVYFGAFNAEAHLDDSEHFVQLPSIPDNDAEKIIHSMDELLFPLCTPKDYLLTRYAVKTAQKHYLESIGIQFRNNAESIDSTFSSAPTVVSLLAEKGNIQKYKTVFSKDVRLSPYAQIPQIEQLCASFEIPFQGPPLDVVKKVNSKIYSHEIHKILEIPRYSERVSNINELRVAASKLSGKKFLLKYPNGVSGKGNLLIQSDAMFERIVRYFESQIKKGKILELLVEPFFDKMTDFSCQMEISRDGNCKILSVQKMENSNFAYWGSNSADSELYTTLEEKGYFQLMQRVGLQLFKDGYFGFVCVDSMLLTDKTLVPIVEINARKSMGLINYNTNERLQGNSLKSHLRFLSVGIKSTFSYEHLLDKMSSAELLYRNNGKSGILPLASNSVSINRDADLKPEEGKIYKGRLYFSGAAPDVETANTIFDRFRIFLRQIDISIYN